LMSSPNQDPQLWIEMPHHNELIKLYFRLMYQSQDQIFASVKEVPRELG